MASPINGREPSAECSPEATFSVVARGAQEQAQFAALSLATARQVSSLPDLQNARRVKRRSSAGHGLLGTTPSRTKAARGDIFRLVSLGGTSSVLTSMKELCASSKALARICRAARGDVSSWLHEAKACGWHFCPERPVSSYLALGVMLCHSQWTNPVSLPTLGQRNFREQSEGQSDGLVHPQSKQGNKAKKFPRNLVSFLTHEEVSAPAMALVLTSHHGAPAPFSSSSFEAVLRYAPLPGQLSQQRAKKASGTQMTAGGESEPQRRSRLRRILNAIISRKNRVAPTDGGAQPPLERFDSLYLDATRREGGADGDVGAPFDDKRRKRVLILMSDTGGGHRASAEALKATFQLEFGDKYEVNIVDCWKDHTPFPFNQLPKSYNFLVKHETLWKMAFHASKPRFVHQPQMAATAAFVARELAKMLDIHRPDIIVSVHPLMQHVPLRVLRSRGLLHRIPFATVVTDLTTCHPTWFHKWASLCFCPTLEVARRALRAGLTPAQLRVHGLPIRPAFARPPSSPKDKLREQLGMHKDLPAVLLIGGGEGMGPVEATALALARRLGTCDEAGGWGVESEPKGQLVVVCGRNKKLRAKLDALDWPMPTQVLGFVTNMPDLMAACDCIITKAGPGTIAESLIRGLPLVLNDFIAGQEVGNVPYVVDNGAGVFCDIPREIAQIVSDWFGPRKADFLLMAQNARAMARPNAVFRIVHDLDSIVRGAKLSVQPELAYAL